MKRFPTRVDWVRIENQTTREVYWVVGNTLEAWRICWVNFKIDIQKKRFKMEIYSKDRFNWDFPIRDGETVVFKSGVVWIWGGKSPVVAEDPEPIEVEENEEQPNPAEEERKRIKALRKSLREAAEKRRLTKSKNRRKVN